MGIPIRRPDEIQFTAKEKRDGGIEASLKGADDVGVEMFLCLPAELTGEKKDLCAVVPIGLQTNNSGDIAICIRNVGYGREHAPIILDLLIRAEEMDISGAKVPVVAVKITGDKRFGNFQGDDSEFRTIAYVALSELL
jgi:hypothetical protein